MSDDKKKSGDDATTGKVVEMDNREVLRLREQLAAVKKELADVQTRAQNTVNSLSNEIRIAGERESAHLAALRAISSSVEDFNANKIRFDALAKDVEVFDASIKSMSDRIARIEMRLGGDELKQ